MLGEASADFLGNAGADQGSGTASDGDRTGLETKRETFFISKATSAGNSVQSIVAGASANFAGIVGDVVQLGYNMEHRPNSASFFLFSTAQKLWRSFGKIIFVAIAIYRFHGIM